MSNKSDTQLPQHQQPQQQSPASSYSSFSTHSDVEDNCPSTVIDGRPFVYYRYPHTPLMQLNSTACDNTMHGYENNRSRSAEEYHLPPIFLPPLPRYSPFSFHP